jgi:signal transduction histidine kinase
MNRREARLRSLRLSLLFGAGYFAIECLSTGLMFAGSYALYNTGFTDPAAMEGLPVLMLILISLAVGALLAALFSRLPLKPLQAVMDGADRIAGGDYSARIHLKGGRDLRQLGESFNHMARELQSMEMLRSDFVNDFSHEFKTPIVSIRGFAKMLKRTDLEEAERQEYLDIILEESQRLADLSANVLNLSRLEGQAILQKVTAFNASEQIRRTIALLAGRWPEKDLTFTFEGGEAEIAGNAELLSQVWINLLDNAGKFAPIGSTVTAAVSQGDRTTVFAFSNAGPPLPPATLARLFDKFYQGDPSRATAGNGLGLAIARRIVDLHGGTLTAACANGRITFTVTLPSS